MIMEERGKDMPVGNGWDTDRQKGLSGIWCISTKRCTVEYGMALKESRPDCSDGRELTMHRMQKTRWT